MTEYEKLIIYIEKLKEISIQNLQDKDITAIQALKQALNYIEGEMIGY